jgi:hypothetical protein
VWICHDKYLGKIFLPAIRAVSTAPVVRIRDAEPARSSHEPKDLRKSFVREKLRGREKTLKIRIPQKQRSF